MTFGLELHYNNTKSFLNITLSEILNYEITIFICRYRTYCCNAFVQH